MKRFILLGLIPLFALAAPLRAQQSTSFTIEQGTINSGGNPAPVLSSPSFQLSLDSIGDGVAGIGMSSAGYGLDTGFAPLYRPPGEVRNLRFATDAAFTWNAEPSVGSYNTYRGAIGSFGASGNCLHSTLVATGDSDSQEPTGGAGWFYVVSAENRLAEEGTTGSNSTGTPRPISSPCP